MATKKDTIVIGLISDTHGLVRPEARHALTGVDAIIHAGDICTPEVIDTLQRIAPVTAVRGNNDRGPWAETLREMEEIELGGVRIRVLHDLTDLDRLASVRSEEEPQASRVIVSGHSHRPSVRREGGVLFVNPGSAGPRRFRLPISVGFLDITDGQCRARLQTLEVD
jgi:putative phosphoesterase